MSGAREILPVRDRWAFRRISCSTKFAFNDQRCDDGRTNKQDTDGKVEKSLGFPQPALLRITSLALNRDERDLSFSVGTTNSEYHLHASLEQQ